LNNDIVIDPGIHWDMDDIDFEKEFTPSEREVVVMESVMSIVDAMEGIYVQGLGGIGVAMGHTGHMGRKMTSCTLTAYKDQWEYPFFDQDEESKCNGNSTPMFGKDPNKVFGRGKKKW